MSSTKDFESDSLNLYSDISDGGKFVGALSDPTSAEYIQRRNVLDVVNDLHSFGLQQEFDLPQIAVVGSQSTGKSSLIESMSRIRLPRSSGTCTRCPIECRLSRTSHDWKCEVYIRRPNASEIQFGEVITDDSEVEDRIRRAQIAILNPNTSELSFLDENLVEPKKNQLSFSSDLVSVRISGRNMDDLSFVDLPGIIASVRDDGDQSDIQQVRSLVAEYIKKPSCLILMVTSCETDLENQGARQLVKEVDPEGHRVIPVLTKPDRIAAGEHKSWLELLEGKRERFRHPWHCVKQPNQKQLEARISREEANQNEVEFFKTEEPWALLDPAIRSRVGTRSLVQTLGRSLFQLICKRLPALIGEIDRTVHTTRSQLEELPPKIEGEPFSVVRKLIEAFRKDVEVLVEGRPRDGVNGLIQRFTQNRRIFREEIFRLAPQFRPFKRPSQETSYDSEVENQTDKLEPKGPRDPATVVYIDEVVQIAECAQTRELPHNYPYAIKKEYIARFLKPWPEPAYRFFESMEKELLEQLRNLAYLHFERFSSGGLNDRVLLIIFNQMEVSKRNTLQKLWECIELEMEEPATANEDDFAEFKGMFLARYKAAREPHTARDHQLQSLINGDLKESPSMKEALRYLRELGLVSVDENTILQLLPNDPSDGAIDIMAEVRAYYQIAFKRFVDYIPKIIDKQLFKGFANDLDLFRGLELDNDQAKEKCAVYLEEDDAIVYRRDSLVQDLERFRGALQKLQKIPGVGLAGHEGE